MIIIKVHSTLLVVLHGCTVLVRLGGKQLLRILADLLLRHSLFSFIVFFKLHLIEPIFLMPSVHRRINNASAGLLICCHNVRHLLRQVDTVFLILRVFVFLCIRGSDRSSPFWFLSLVDVFHVSLLDGHVGSWVASSAARAVIALIIAPVHLVQVLLVSF